MRETKRAVVPPVDGGIMTVPVTFIVVVATILGPDPRPRPETYLPRPLPRAPCEFRALFPTCELPFELKPSLLLLLFDELVLPFAALLPFPRRLRPCPRPPCQRTAVTFCTITMNGDFSADLHGVIRRGTIGDIFKV